MRKTFLKRLGICAGAVALWFNSALAAERSIPATKPAEVQKPSAEMEMFPPLYARGDSFAATVTEMHARLQQAPADILNRPLYRFFTDIRVADLSKTADPLAVTWRAEPTGKWRQPWLSNYMTIVGSAEVWLGFEVTLAYAHTLDMVIEAFPASGVFQVVCNGQTVPLTIGKGQRLRLPCVTGANTIMIRVTAGTYRIVGEKLSIAEYLAANLKHDFPVESDWLDQDLTPQNGIVACFTPGQPVDCEHLLAQTVAELDIRQQQRYRKEIESLRQIGVPAGDIRWWTLYQQAAQDRRLHRLAPLLERCDSVIFVRRPTFGGFVYARTEKEGADPCAALCQLDLRTIRNGGLPSQRILIEAPGGIRDPDLSWDAKRLLFAWRQQGKNYNYQIHEYDLATGMARRLTDDTTYGASIEPAYLPSGRIIFNSSRIVQIITCGFGDCSNLFIMEPDGQYPRRVGFDQTSSCFPHVIEDGRVIYTRRDYNDRNQVYTHSLFTMREDGSGQAEFYGNNTFEPTSFQMTRQIPGTGKFLTILGGYHTWQGGKLAVLDPALGRQGNAGVRLVPSGLPPTSPTHNDVYGTDGDQYQHPYPITADTFLVSYAKRAPNGQLAPYGVYLMDMQGRRELLAQDERLPCLQALPVMPRRRPNSWPSTLDYRRTDGICMVQNVYLGDSAVGIKPGSVKKLRVVQLRYKPVEIGWGWTGRVNRLYGAEALPITQYGASMSPVASPDGTFDIKAILGDVPVEADGSACFKVPARIPVYFQLLDANNRVIQNMRSWTTLMPGEVLSCVGCHENKNAAPPPQTYKNLAIKAGPKDLQPFYGPLRGFSYIKEIQPILDKHCVCCHQPNGRNSKFLLTSELVHGTFPERPNPGTFSKRKWLRSYLTLVEYDPAIAPSPWHNQTRWLHWIGRLSDPPLQPPYSAGSIISPLFDLLEKGHGGRVRLSREELDKLAAWVDLNIPYCGEYDESNEWTETEKAYYVDRAKLRLQMDAMDEQQVRALAESRK